MIRPHKQLVKPYESMSSTSSKVLELHIAKEILAETFQISIHEVEDMIQNRFETCSQGRGRDGRVLWPREFWLDD
ncbi:MAG: hypothetical protein GYA29_06315 [Methanothrix sp.]|jgi:hypothetical protein|nr:hypothetical protein [Methanothrix sp.]